MSTQRAASIPLGLKQQQWTGLRGLEMCSASAESWTRACEGPRSRAQKKSKIGPPGSPQITLLKEGAEPLKEEREPTCKRGLLGRVTF